MPTQDIYCIKMFNLQDMKRKPTIVVFKSRSSHFKQPFGSTAFKEHVCIRDKNDRIYQAELK